MIQTKEKQLRKLKEKNLSHPAKCWEGVRSTLSGRQRKTCPAEGRNCHCLALFLYYCFISILNKDTQLDVDRFCTCGHDQKLRSVTHKLNVGVIFAIDFLHVMAYLKFCVETDFLPEGPPCRKSTKECLAPLIKTKKHNRKRRKATGGKAGETAKLRQHGASDTVYLH